MRKRIIDSIQRLVLSFIKNKYTLNAEKKVLISTNKYYCITSWQTLIDNDYHYLKKNCEFIFCKNKYEVKKHYLLSDACFLFSSDYLSINDKKKKLLYLPILGIYNNYQKNTNIILEQPPPFAGVAIAEYCLMMVILLTRNLHHSFRLQHLKRWDQSIILNRNFNSIMEMKIGVLGVGRIGKIIASYFKKIGCFIIGCDILYNTTVKDIDLWYSNNDLLSFLKSIDILIISLPLNNDTIKIISTKELEALGENSFLINISRGEVIDENALYNALKNNKIAGAAIDTFTKEPLSFFSKLYRLNNIIITPHISGNINLFKTEIQKDFLNKLSKYLTNV